jgi:hypothetical protein
MVRARTRNKNRANKLCTFHPQVIHNLSTTYPQGDA